MKSFIDQAKRYHSQHNSRITWYTHIVGIPVILFSFLILFGFLHLVVPSIFDITFADIFVIILLAYYFWLNWKLASVITPVLFFMLWLASLISYAGPTSFALWTFAILFLLGCAMQLVGHLIVGNKPAIWDHPKDSIAAPMFLVAEVFFMIGWMSGLRAAIYDDEIESETEDKTKKKMTKKKQA